MEQQETLYKQANSINDISLPLNLTKNYQNQ